MRKNRISISDIIVGLKCRLWKLFHSRYFRSFGRNTRIDSPLKIDGSKNISLGEYVNIGYKSWLAALPLTNNAECELVIGNGSAIGHFNHIYATKSIRIGKNVLTADKVYISDNQHGYEDPRTPVMHQPIVQKQSVVIGDDSWLGENVCVIGASIGCHCVIGANSVVTRDIPDYCVAVGIPAKIIKRYDFSRKTWDKIG